MEKLEALIIIIVFVIIFTPIFVKEVCDDIYKVKPEYDGCIIVDKSNTVLFKYLVIKTDGNPSMVECFGIHFEEYAIGDTLKTERWK